MKRYLGPIMVLIVIGFLVFGFNLNNQLFWDDDDWIIQNPFVHDFQHIKEIFTENILSGFGLNSNYYRPLLLVSFAFNWVLHGANSFGYHLVSNFFHIGSAILIFLLLTTRRFVVFGQRAAFLAALFWLIHPLNTEAVTYISGRGDPMSVFFMLLALWLYVIAQGISRKFWLLSGSILSMVLAVLSRETAILFPALLMIFLLFFEYKDRVWTALKKSFIASIPFWIVSIVYFLLRLTVLNFNNTLNFYSKANIYTENLSYRLFTFGHVLVEYFKLILVPLNLHMERDLPIKTSLFQWPVWLAVIIVTVILFVWYVLYKKSEAGKIDPIHHRVWGFSWTWFFVGLAPVSGIIPINAIMYEHWLYLPLVGVAILFGFYLSKLLSVLKSKRFLYSLVIAVIVAYASFLSILTIKRNIVWGNPVGFYEDILRYNPETVRVINNLANLYSDEGKNDKAAELYQQAIESRNGRFFAQPYYNLGNIYRDEGNINRAIELYKQAVEVDPLFPFTYQNLAVIYAERGELNQAVEMLEKVKELRSLDPLVYYNLAIVYNVQGNLEAAAQNVELGLKLIKGNEELEKSFKKLLQ